MTLWCSSGKELDQVIAAENEELRKELVEVKAGLTNVRRLGVLTRHSYAAGDVLQHRRSVVGLLAAFIVSVVGDVYSLRYFKYEK